ncbi:hypothetical protein, partial [Proteus mirabilis]
FGRASRTPDSFGRQFGVKEPTSVGFFTSKICCLIIYPHQAVEVPAFRNARILCIIQSPQRI